MILFFLKMGAKRKKYVRKKFYSATFNRLFVAAIAIAIFQAEILLLIL